MLRDTEAQGHEVGTQESIVEDVCEVTLLLMIPKLKCIQK